MMRRSGLATLVFMLIGVPVYSGAQQTPQVVVDTDAGTDDLMAISYLLAGREVDLKAITAVNGLAHVKQGAKNILKLLELAGRTEIPVFVGETHPLAGNAAFPEEWRRLSDNPPDVKLPQSVRSPEKQSAVEYLAKEMRLAGGGPSLRILALGPLTNIAKALEAYPSRVRGIRSIVIMGGAISVPGNLGDGGVFKTENKTAEWNMYIDPLAASRVFASGVSIELVPLDATNHVPIDGAFVRDFSKKTATPLGRFVSQLFASERDLIEQHAFYAWDPLAAVILAHPGVARFKDYRIEIEMKPPAEGHTRSVPAGKANTRVATDADSAAFMRLFTAAFLQRTPQRH
jgi:inosine-uridine nucleoside N-ribohydrolase